MSIRNIIFDIGNVLADFSWEPHYRSFGFSEEVFERLARATVKSPQWNEVDRGVLSTEELIEAFVNNDPGIEAEIRQVLRDVSPMVTKRDYAIPWIQHLKGAGYDVYYLSNFGEATKMQCQEALSFVPYTDGGILSCDIKLIKPEPGIYKALLEKYSLVAEECIFVDDLETNLVAAGEFGIHSVHATSHEAALEGLRELGVSPYKINNKTEE